MAEGRGPLWRTQGRELGFGLAGPLFSSFGQTYFLALFLLAVVEGLNGTPGAFGILYSAATVAAALALPRFGRWLDVRGERTAFSVASLGLVASMALLASAPTWWVLFPALFGLRTFGQGAMTLISATAMARCFERRRGLALGISHLGFPLGEMVLPALAIWTLRFFGWRTALFLFAGLLAALCLAVRLGLLARPLRNEEGREIPGPTTRTDGKATKTPRWWTDSFFLLVTAAAVAMPLGGTIVFLYLGPLSQERGWSLEWIGTGFAVYAATRAATSLCVGPLIDRWGGLRVFAWTLLPFSAALLVLILAASPWAALVFFVLAGLGFGAGTALTALLAEAYGSGRLGEIRSTSSSLIILGAAWGPMMAGLALENGWSFESILTALLIVSLFSPILALVACRLGSPPEAKRIRANPFL